MLSSSAFVESSSLIDLIVDDLSHHDLSELLSNINQYQIPLPSATEIEKAVELLKAILFPGYFGESDVNINNVKYSVGENVHQVIKILKEQTYRCLQFNSDGPLLDSLFSNSSALKGYLEKTIYGFLSDLKDIKRTLSLDVIAAYQGDPAAVNIGECIFCYPGISAIMYHRIAHAFLNQGVPLLPRIIAELSHHKTGIDIHPGAQIGKGFFIDHGTGTVIGGTAILGDNVRLYHGVTLGAKNFPVDRDGNIIKGMPRHPILQDNVVVYAGASILGRVTVGAGASIGSNTCVTENVPPGVIVNQKGIIPKKADGVISLDEMSELALAGWYSI
jgi:serine O-acetyltransferase